jgi:HSF-type DNA-binding
LGAFRKGDFFHAIMNIANYRADVAAHGHGKATMFDMALERRAIFNRGLGFPRCSAVEIGGSEPPPARSAKKLQFPHRLFRMLEEIRQCRPYLSHIISWHDDCDTAFVINNLEAFLVEVMPVYFGSQSKFASFQRQLNNYDFQRVQDRRQHGSLIYWHKNFSRAYPHMIQDVVLKKCKTNHQHQSSTPPQLSAVVLELLLSASYTANSSHKSLSKQFNYDDDVVGDDVLDEAAAQILCDATVIAAGTSRTNYSTDHCSSSEEACQSPIMPPVDPHLWDPDTESIICCEEEEDDGPSPHICQSS